jgi:hypothetical protein
MVRIANGDLYYYSGMCCPEMRQKQYFSTGYCNVGGRSIVNPDNFSLTRSKKNS